jgi:hypothetical protein
MASSPASDRLQARGRIQDREGRDQLDVLMKEELGRRWLEPDLFRIGASSMLGDIERQLEHHVTGPLRPSRTSPRLRKPMPSVTEILDTMDYGPAPEANGHVTRLAESS